MAPGTGQYNYDVELTMANANGANIGSHDSKSVGYYDPVKVTSSLEDTLEITTRMMSDELKFKISSQEWSSNSNGDVPKCAVGGWDPHHVAPAIRQMDWFYAY